MENDRPQIINTYGAINQSGRNQQGSKFYLIFIGIVILIFGIIFAIGKMQKSPSGTNVLSSTESKTGSIVPADWKRYSSKTYGLTFAVPNNVTITENKDGSLTLEYIGTQQLTRTDFYDGIRLTIKQDELGAKTVKQIADETVKKEQAAYKQIVSPLSSITLKNKQGFSLTTKREITTTYIFLPVDPKKILTIMYDLQDPGKKGYQDIADQIIVSLEFSPPADLAVSNSNTNATNSTLSPITEPSPLDLPDPTWKRVTIEDAGLEFGIPQKIVSYGQVKSKISATPTGYSGSQICVSIVLKPEDDPCSVVLFGVGTITKDYNVARAALYIDLQGFEKTDGKYFAILGEQKIELPGAAVKEIQNPNGVSIIKVRGYDNENGSVPGTPGSGYIAALINTKNEKYPGITVLLKIVQDITEIDMDQILSTFRYTK